MEEILTADQVAQILQVHPFTVLKFIKQGKLKASKLGRVYRIRRSDVDGFLDSQIEQSEAKESPPQKTDNKKQTRKGKTAKTPKALGEGSKEAEQPAQAMKITVHQEESNPERENTNDVDHYVLEIKR